MTGFPTQIDAVLLLVGVVVMAHAAVRARSLLGELRPMHRRPWAWLTVLIGVFLVGYLAALAGVLAGERAVVEGIAALIFALGAVFVWVVVRASVALGRELMHELDARTRVEEGLRTAVRHRDEFLSVASHELKSPLTTLMLQQQMRERQWAAEGAPAPTAAELTQAAADDRRHLLRLVRQIDDMLDVTRIAAGRLRLERGPVDLGELVREVVGRQRPELDAARCVTTVDAPEGVVGTWDRHRLEQVLTNLLSNASKYAPGAPVRCAVRSTGTTAVVEVEDHGHGIAPADLPRIFRRYERIDETRQVHGLGLGLYIVRQIVEAHQGTITVDSEVGRGTTFRIELPLA